MSVNIFANNNNNNNNPNFFQNNNNNNIFNRSNNAAIFNNNSNTQTSVYNNHNSLPNNQTGGNNPNLFQQSTNIFQQNNPMINTNLNNNNNNNNNNIFANSNTTPIPFNNNQNTQGSQYNNNMNNNANNIISAGSVPLIGSQRGKYEVTKSSLNDSLAPNSVPLMNTSIIFCRGFDKLNPVLLRLEDYYLIRTGNLNNQEQQKINAAVQINSFNPQLFNLPQNFQPPNVSALSKDIRLVQSQYISNTPAVNNQNNNSGNIFQNNNVNAQQKNIVLNRSVNSTNPQTANIFNQGGNNNMFPTNNPNNNNIFQANNQSNVATQANSLFAQNSATNNAGGVFNNNGQQQIFNNSNAQSSLFNNNNNNNNNNNHINRSQVFNNNNVNTPNIFANSNNVVANNVFQNNTNLSNSNIQRNNINGGNSVIFNNGNGANSVQQNRNVSIFSNNNNPANQNIAMSNANNNIFNKNNNVGGVNNTGTNSIFSDNSKSLFTGGQIFKNDNNKLFQNNSIFNNSNTTQNIGGNQNIFQNQNAFNQDNTGGSIFGKNNNTGIFANSSNAYNYQNPPAMGSNGYYSIQSGMYYQPTQSSQQYTLEQYLDMKDKEQEERKKVKATYFMPQVCPEEYAPVFQKRQAKQIYVDVGDAKGYKKISTALSKFTSNDNFAVKSRSSESTLSNEQAYQMTQSAIKEKKSREEFNFYNQPAQPTKNRELQIREKLAQTDSLTIKVEALCFTLDGEEEDIILESEINTESKVKSIGLFCKDHLLKMGRMKEPTRPYFFQVYYNSNLIRDDDSLVNDILPVKYDSTFQCEVIFEYDRHPFMNTSDYILTPPLADLQQLPLKQLKSIQNFSIEGKFGKLEWLEPVDLTDLDIDKTIHIRDRSIQVYPEVEFISKQQPKVGEGINNRCRVTYKNASDIIQKITSKEYTIKQVIRCIQKQCKTQNVEFLSFNEDDLTWSIFVEHFSGYSFNLDDEDKDEEEQTLPPPKANSSIPQVRPIQDSILRNSQAENQSQLHEQSFTQFASIPIDNQLEHQSILMQKKQQNEIQSQINNPLRPVISSVYQTQRTYFSKYCNNEFFSKRNQNNINMGNLGAVGRSEQGRIIPGRKIGQMNQHNINEVGIYGRMENEIIPEETELCSVNNTQGEINIVNGDGGSSFHETPEEIVEEKINMDRFIDFKNIVEERKKKIQQKQKHVPKKHALLPNLLKRHPEVVAGIIKLNHCVYQHKMEECVATGHQFYNDFSFTPSWNQHSFVTLSRSAKVLQQHTFQNNHIGRVLAVGKESIKKYNRVVIDGFLESIIESQQPEFYKQLGNSRIQFEQTHNLSYESLPSISIPKNNEYTLFLVLYCKNHLIPAIILAENERHQDLIHALNDELTILSLINILFGNPQLDIVSILNKIRKRNSFPESCWRSIIEGLRNQKRFLRDDIVQNLRKMQLKKFLASKFSAEGSNHKKRQEASSGAQIEEKIINCLKRHDINEGARIAEQHGHNSLGMLLTTLEMKKGNHFVKNLNSSEIKCFPRILNLLKGKVSEVQNGNGMCPLNRFACELWYHHNERDTLATVFDIFVSKESSDQGSPKSNWSLEMLLLALYSQQELSEKSSEKLRSLQLFVELNSGAYAANKLDKRLSWFVIEFLNALYFKDNDPLLLKEKRARLMRGFSEQLALQKRWTNQVVLLLLMKDILKRGELMYSIRDLFLRNCLPNSRQNSSEMSEIIDHEGSPLEQILGIFRSVYSTESFGLFHYSQHEYAHALRNLIASNDHFGICNKIIAYYEGPRVYLFGDSSEREEMLGYLASIQKSAAQIPKYRHESGLIASVFPLLQPMNLYEQKNVTLLLSIKDLLVDTQNPLTYVSMPNYYQIVTGQKCLLNTSDSSLLWIHQANNTLFKEFVSFVFSQLAAKVPLISRYTNHTNNNFEIIQLFEILSEYKAPNNEQIKQLIISTLPSEQ